MVVARWMLAAVVGVGAVGGVAGLARAADEPKKEEAAKVEAIDFRKLKELLPAEVAGLKRAEATGEKNKFGEMQISQAEGRYEKKGDESENAPRVTVKFMDYGGMKGAAEMMAMTWTAVEIDKDSDQGWEKTVKVGDAKWPGQQTWNTEGKSGRLMVLVGKRYIVEVDTDYIPEAEFKKIADTLPLAKLAELK